VTVYIISILISFRHWSHSLISGNLLELLTLVISAMMTIRSSHMHQTNVVITITNILILEFSWRASLNSVNCVKYSSTNGGNISTC